MLKSSLLVKKITKEKIITYLISITICLFIIGCYTYYQNGSYLVGKNCFTVTNMPSEKFISKYKKVDYITIDNDGSTLLISPCKNNMDVRISRFKEGTNGIEYENEILCENKSMNTNEAFIVKVRKDNSQLIKLFGKKVWKVFIIDISSKELSGNTTKYLQFY